MLCSKFPMKMHEKCDFNEKKKDKRDLLKLDDKNPWEICGRKRQNRLRLHWSKNSLNKMTNMWEKFLFKDIPWQISISWKLVSVDWKFGKLKFLKKKKSNFIQKLLNFIHNISWMKCMSMRLKVCQKHMNSTQIFQEQYFQPFLPQKSNIKPILYQNQGTYNLGCPKHVHTQYHILSLARNNLCNVCN